MTRPDDIPQRVWDAAQSVMMESRLFMIATDDFDEHSSIIARAILAAEQREREANRQNEDAILRADERSNNWMQAIAVRAAAIRNRKETP